MDATTSSKLLQEWWRLPHDERERVLAAVDTGVRVPDERLRPVAEALALEKARGSGWHAIASWPRAIIAIALLLLPMFIGLWWWSLVIAVGLVAALLLAERRARTMRSHWEQAVIANSASLDR